MAIEHYLLIYLKDPLCNSGLVQLYVILVWYNSIGDIVVALVGSISKNMWSDVDVKIIYFGSE